MNQIDASQRIYFRNLDTLRFLAAYLIVCLHCFFGWKAFFGHPSFLANGMPEPWMQRLEIAVHNFSFGVDIFFVISGFLITYLLLSEQQKTGRVDVMKFYIRRAFRIWPLYFLMILAGPLLTYFFLEQSPDYLYQFFFAGNFDVINQGPKSVATDHLWSICIEEHFYLFCPLLVAFIPVRKLPQVLLSIIMVSIVFRAYTASQAENYGMKIYMHTLSRIDILALGSLLGYLHFYRKIRFDHSRGVRYTLYGLFLALFLLVDYNECGSLFTATMKKYVFVLLVAYWAGNFLFHPQANFFRDKLGLFNRFGKASYGIYMFNPVAIFLVLKLFQTLNWQNYFLFLVLSHVLLFAVTYASYRFFELPFLALKEKYAVVKSGEAIEEGEKETEEEEGLVTEQKIIPIGKINER